MHRWSDLLLAPPVEALCTRSAVARAIRHRAIFWYCLILVNQDRIGAGPVLALADYAAWQIQARARLLRTLWRWGGLAGWATFGPILWTVLTKRPAPTVPRIDPLAVAAVAVCWGWFLLHMIGGR